MIYKYKMHKNQTELLLKYTFCNSYIIKSFQSSVYECQQLYQTQTLLWHLLTLCLGNFEQAFF